MRILSVLTMGAALVAVPVLEAAAAKPVAAVITRLRGKVEVNRYGTKDWVRARRNMILHEGDSVRTKKRRPLASAVGR